MKPKHIILISIIIVFAILIIINLNNNKQIACTEDARICPDGTGVGRIPPDCEFAPCPTSKICKLDKDCIVFGKDGECNCGCYNENALPEDSGGACFCAAPSSCKCINEQCEGVFKE